MSVFDIFVVFIFIIYVIYNEYKRIKLIKHILRIINIQGDIVNLVGSNIETAGTVLDYLLECPAPYNSRK